MAWLEQHLHEYPGTIVAVTHDRYFLDNVAGWILELDRGAGIPWEGNYSSLARAEAKRLEGRGEGRDRRGSARSRASSSGCAMSPRARQAKSKARLAAYEELLARGVARSATRRIEISIPPGPRLGDLVVEAESVRKGYGDKLLIDDLTFNLPRGGIVGIIGPNGAGKTTLFRMIVGPGEAGRRHARDRRHREARLRRPEPRRARRRQDGVRGDRAAAREIIELGKRKIPSRAYVGGLQLQGRPTSRSGSSDLSGGERNRVHLAKLLKSGGNVLLLDEPTNDLDVDTLRALEEALLDFAGCAVVISHDRWFLDRIATHILAFEGDSQVVWFEGNYQDYEADRKRRLGADADQPHRIKYKKLIHLTRFRAPGDRVNMSAMISYEELDRALGRWKARSKAGVPEAPGAPDDRGDAAADPRRGAGSIPTAVSPIPGEPPARSTPTSSRPTKKRSSRRPSPALSPLRGAREVMGQK